ncbi:MAG: hypothetical protein CSA19_01325 [Deltaproteobacteria bacterium]|nr:MAG: hypothetical protein CSA19_01325 [Deltaproteobacteria bacterium]
MAAEPARPEPVIRNGRGHSSERPACWEKIIIIIIKIKGGTRLRKDDGEGRGKPGRGSSTCKGPFSSLSKVYP